ncbi:M56 family metallopeptidase [Chitinophaga horti]|uniref:M56 family metallopeptidase n=1 Tax=Chitinophaga horti TaxID=2920382 RepID=A0ABY6J525_9BACT|nr:M56 family metallopeptidase [Chitinophaga horti]UYQ94708.1 M56 family metallopeptidase [Chitinophaga horti]
MFAEQWLHHPIVAAFGRTLLHSLWQGALAAAIAGLVILCTRRSAASRRYVLIGGIQLLFLAGTLLTFYLTYTAHSPGQVAFNTAAGAPSAIQAARPGFVEALERFLNQYTGWIVLTWALIFMFRTACMGAGLWHIRQLRTTGTQLPDNAWRHRFYDLKHDMGIRKVVKLLESARVKVPLTVGTFKPVVLVPLGLLGNLPAEQLETILMHELAHIRRNDYLVNLVQHITETIFFFNPGLLWVSALLKEEREACCDEIVLAHTKREDAYMQALVSFQEFTLTQNQYAMSLKDHPGQLFARIKRMLTGENEQLGGTGKLMLMAGVLVLATLCFISAAPVAVTTVPASWETVAPVKRILFMQEPTAVPTRRMLAAEPQVRRADTLPTLKRDTLVFAFAPVTMQVQPLSKIDTLTLQVKAIAKMDAISPIQVKLNKIVAIDPISLDTNVQVNTNVRTSINVSSQVQVNVQEPPNAARENNRPTKK